MAKYQLLLPKMGESVAEATIIKWNKNPGDYIEADEAVMEIATDKVDSDVPSPVSGKLVQQLCNENDVVQVGAVIAIIETEEVEEAVAEETLPAAEPQAVDIPDAPAEQPPISEPIPGLEQLEARVGDIGGESFKSSVRFYSPLVKNIASQEGISVEELDKIPGTGAEGRLTKDDLLNYLQNPSTVAQQSASQVQNTPKPVEASAPISSPAQPQAQVPQPEKPAEPKAAPAISVSGGDEIIEMDRMRRLIADHMVMSKQTSPHVTSFVEADVTNLVLWREKNKGAFEKKEGEKIT
ncbi:MAG: biotin/lipoyl-containing protein, partial [Mucilaginibacter sp.]